MAKGYEYNFKEFDPEFERLVEIYNSWGSSECTAKDGNPTPIHSKTKKGIGESGEGAIQKALLQNLRFGFVAGGLDDRGAYTGLYDEGQEQYPPGLTAIIASEYSRTAMADALYNRSCYATTGERIILGVSLAGTPMGKEVSTAEKPGLLVNRHIAGYIAGTNNLQAVEIIRNGKVIKVFEGSGYALEFTFDDLVPLSQVVMPSKDKKPPFAFYYIRVTQDDGHMAWSSPIWVDLLPPQPGVKAQPKRVVKPEPVLLDFDVEEEEEEEEEDDLEE